MIPCKCGSGLARYPLLDAAGIFCTYVCVECEDTTRKTYNPKIFEANSRYAESGDEADLLGE